MFTIGIRAGDDTDMLWDVDIDTGSASTDSFSRLILISGNVELMETGTEMATGCDGGATTVVMETEIGVVVETAAVTVDKEVG